MSFSSGASTRSGKSIISTIVTSFLLLAAAGIIVMGLASLSARCSNDLEQVQEQVQVRAQSDYS